mmetsp:Transcript_16763/g.38787  ORF Transcript_16763/g.38787 Transcript_16763/m.38787 type:complete len:1807 (+) Transcript_16763:74-5494(+)
MGRGRWRLWSLLLLTRLAGVGGDLPPSMERYAPKSCKYNMLPASVNTRAFTSYTGEVHVNDVFGVSATAKRHVLRLDMPKSSLLTLSAETHRDSSATLRVSVFRRGAAYTPSNTLITGSTSVGAGGDNMKVFLHGRLDETSNSFDVVFELETIEVSSSQVDSKVIEDKCLAVRLDMTAIPTSRAPLTWPSKCGSAFLPSDFMRATQVLGDSGLSLQPIAVDQSPGHYIFHFDDMMNSRREDFQVAVWSITVEVPQRLHRFARLFFRTSFRFASSPLALVLELFDLKDIPDGVALYPDCKLGCLGGVPVFNGQVLDHAMPTGFKYKIWLMSTDMTEWVQAAGRGRRCLEFDLEYDIRFEPKLTPFEVGPSAWLCESSKLPDRIIQTEGSALSAHSAHVQNKGSDTIVVGRSVWLRDRFGFPPHEVEDMEHDIELVLAEPSIIRATTHHAEGVDVFLALQDPKTHTRVCKTVGHPGPAKRQTIFCRLDPGTYTLTFFAEYPLGGLHPCGDFFAQVSVRPVSLANDAQNARCVQTSGDLEQVAIPQSLSSVIQPKWQSIQVPIDFQVASSIVSVWHQSFDVAAEDVAHQLFLRLVVHSDYATSDLRFQVRYRGKYVANTQVTAQGYADMIGPLDAGSYAVEMYYVSPSYPQMPKGITVSSMCSTSFVDFRLVSQAAYANHSAMWLCTASRVPPPDMLAPRPDEPILLDSEYVIPNSGAHSMKLMVSEDRLLKVWLDSQFADFDIELRQAGQAYATGTNNLEVMLSKGTWTFAYRALRKGSSGSCMTMTLHMLLQPVAAIAQCPWSATSSEYSADQEAVGQVSADDHIGQLKLNLEAKDLSKDVDTFGADAAHLWLSVDMEKSFEMSLPATSSVRIEALVQPPFLPIEITLRRKRPSGRLEPPSARSDWVESRLLLMQSDLPRGDYLLTISQPRQYTATNPGDESRLQGLCAHLTIFAEVGTSSKDAVNSMRSELLELPDLLAVQPFVPHYNLVGWYATPLAPMLGTTVYRFKPGDGGARAPLQLTERAIVRAVCEPADLSNADASLIIEKDGQSVAVSDNLGALVTQLEAGTYNINFKPSEDAPFLMTLGIASLARVKEDLLLEDSGSACRRTMPPLTQEPKPSGWEIGPTIIRLDQSYVTKEGVLAEAPIKVSVPSIIYIEAGSALPLDLIRISLEVPEGLWVGEQRGMRNSLQIEVPPGTYTLHIGQPKPAAADINRCLDFSIYVRCTALVPLDVPKDGASPGVTSGASESSADGKGEALDPYQQAVVQPQECFATGAMPLPLDLNTPQGGSAALYGPIDKDGKLLLRSRVLVTDMHDGRKKMYLSTRNRKSLLKVGVSLGTHAHLAFASQLSFSVTSSTTKKAIEPMETWSTDQGFERIYTLEASTNHWLAFHHTHQEGGESACMHFGLVLEVRPFEDMSKMIECQDSMGAESFVPSSLDVDLSSGFYRFFQPMAYISQPSNGFLRKISFELTKTSWVNVSLPHNFFTSHAEMDIVKNANDKTSLVFSELDFPNTTDRALTVRQILSRALRPGKYVLRFADDHYSGQFGSSGQGCFPFAFEFNATTLVQPPISSLLGTEQQSQDKQVPAKVEEPKQSSAGSGIGSIVSQGSQQPSRTASASGGSGDSGVGAIRAERPTSGGSATNAQVGRVVAQPGQIGAASSGSPGGSDVGAIRMEMPSSSSSRAEEPFRGPVMSQWRPAMAPSPPPPPPLEPVICADGSPFNEATGGCDKLVADSTIWPFGFRTVILACGASIFGLSLLANRGWLSSKFGSKPQRSRFRDIGARSAEEEIGLVNTRYDDEDDML